MDDLHLPTGLSGVLLIILGVVVVLRAVKTVVKVAMVAVVAIGVYLTLFASRA